MGRESEGVNMNVIGLISSSNFIVVNKSLAREIGLVESVVLGELASEYEHWKSTGNLDDGYFYSTVDNLSENTTLSKYQQRSALDNLKAKGIIDVTVKGLPAKRYIKINEEQVEKLLYNKLSKNSTTGCQVFSPAVGEKLDGINNKDNNNNKNNYIKKERRKEQSQEESYDSIIESATENEDLREAYREFIKMRKLKKDPMTNHALHLLIGKAQKLSGGDEAIQKQMLDEAIINGWKSVYPLKEYNVPGCAAVKQKRQRPADAPAWVPDEIFEREDVRIFDTRMPPYNGSVTYMTKLGYGRIEPSSPEEAERIERLYSEWKQSGGKDWQWNGPCAD